MRKVLIACEYSGIVSQAFLAAGFSVTSCDLLPSELSPGDLTLSAGQSYQHFIGPVQSLGLSQFSAMIAFPPCTYLAKCGLHLIHRQPSRAILRDAAVLFVKSLYNSQIPLVAIENPVGYLSTGFRPPDQITSPHYYGSLYSKEICLWLKGLPPLIDTFVTSGQKKVSNHVNSRMPQALKSKIKSRFFPEMATAMALQWSPIIREISI